MKTTTFGKLQDGARFVILDMVDVDESLTWTKHAGRVANAKSDEGEWLALDESVTVKETK